MELKEPEIVDDHHTAAAGRNHDLVVVQPEGIEGKNPLADTAALALVVAEAAFEWQYNTSAYRALFDTDGYR